MRWQGWPRWEDSHMPDDFLPERRPDRLPVEGTGVGPIAERDISGDGWRLYIEYDGWYLLANEESSIRISVNDAVRRVGNRAQIFRMTRLFIQHLARELAAKAYVSPTAVGHEAARSRGLDPKHGSQQIAEAGDIIARLGRELASAEAAPLP